MLHGSLTTPMGISASIQQDYAMIMRKGPRHPLRHGRKTSPMASRDDSTVWVQKGATLSDKTAQKEFGLRQEDILAAIKAAKLHYRHNTLYGNPCLKLGFDHGVGHSLLLLYDTKTPRGQKIKKFNGLGD